MPELPEVETIKNQLQVLQGQTVARAQLGLHFNSLAKTRDFDPTQKKIIRFSRQGKILIFEFENEQYLLSHLGMSGSWILSDQEIPDKHNHLKFYFDKKILNYVDPRRFGKMYFLNLENFKKYMSKYPPDMQSPDFTVNTVYNAIHKFPERKLKVTLLDQNLFFGCGNYMASEICALAGIRPGRSCKRVSLSDCYKIHNACHLLISNVIKSNGNSFSGGYRDAFGDDGGGLSNLVVFYQKTCGLCKITPIKKTTMAGRGTYYCPHCQH
jgi:formamidopyrimidine-DNA glycosylase